MITLLVFLAATGLFLHFHASLASAKERTGTQNTSKQGAYPLTQEANGIEGKLLVATSSNKKKMRLKVVTNKGEAVTSQEIDYGSINPRKIKDSPAWFQYSADRSAQGLRAITGLKPNSSGSVTPRLNGWLQKTISPRWSEFENPDQIGCDRRPIADIKKTLIVIGVILSLTVLVCDVGDAQKKGLGALAGIWAPESTISKLKETMSPTSSNPEMMTISRRLL